MYLTTYHYLNQKGKFAYFRNDVWIGFIGFDLFSYIKYQKKAAFEFIQSKLCIYWSKNMSNMNTVCGNHVKVTYNYEKSTNFGNLHVKAIWSFHQNIFRFLQSESCREIHKISITKINKKRDEILCNLFSLIKYSFINS